MLMSDVIDYDFLVAEFENSLVTTLRSHRPAEEYLEMWVPDEDPVKGLLNMIEAAQIAGRDGIRIKVKLATLPADRHDELRDLAVEIGTTDIRRAGDHAIVTIDGMQGGSDFDVVSEPFHAALKAAYAQLVHEGDPGAAAAGQIRVEVEEGAVRLTAIVDPSAHRIIDARHGGGATAVDRSLLDLLCGLLVGMTMQEAADHAAIKLVDRLRSLDSQRPVPGILMPQNADPAFALPTRLARRLRAAYGEATGHHATRNFFETAPSAAWVGLTLAEKTERVTATLAGYAAAEGIATGEVHLDSIEPNLLKDDVRIIVTLGDGIDQARKPSVARGLEKLLKRQIDAKLELYCTEVKDRNAIRRL